MAKYDEAHPMISDVNCYHTGGFCWTEQVR
jgi:hypothetical protein